MGTGGAPFDRGAAAGALGAVNVQSCKRPDGPTGTGHVKVTFVPDGSTSTVTVDGSFAGTDVGACIEGRYRLVRVPPFTGTLTNVGKSFTVNCPSDDRDARYRGSFIAELARGRGAALFSSSILRDLWRRMA